MWRKVALLLAAVAVLGLIGFAQGKTIKNPDTIIEATIGPAETCDPAYAYDTASGEILFNTYETLVFWPYGIADAKGVDLADMSLDPAKLQPLLATDWTMSDEGMTYTFTIRSGVRFHYVGVKDENGNIKWVDYDSLEDENTIVPGYGELTPEDVEYSIERAMLQDRDGGPVWMLLEPLTGYSSMRDLVKAVLGKEVDDLKTLTPEEQAEIYNKYIDPAVEVQGDKVIFHLAQSYPPFLSILAGSWGSVLDKEWTIAQGDWDGAANDWAKWWNPGGGQVPEKSPLFKAVNGTGPFKLVRWDVGVEIDFARFNKYWRGPAKIANVVIKKLDEWSDRLLLLKNGDADIVYVPSQYLPQVEGLDGVVVHDPIDMPQVLLRAMFFVAPVKLEGNEFIDEGPWDGYGIPADFFADINVRKAFCMAFDYDAFIEQVLMGKGYKIHGPIPKAFDWAYKDDPDLDWNYDLKAATELMKKARNGEIWEKGFNLTILYNQGNSERQVAAEILKTNLEAMNPKFRVKIQAVPWKTYLSYLLSGKMPLFIIGWLADYPDPNNFAVPFTASYGTFSGWQGDYMINNIFKPYFDDLLKQGMATADKAKRAQIYYKIQELAHEYAIDIWLPQRYPYRVMRDWVRNWPINGIYPGPYFYPMYKGYD